MLVLCILTVSFAFASGCPDIIVTPCSCRMIGYHSSVVTCINGENMDELRNSINNLKTSDKPIRTLEIFDSNYMYLPESLFKGLKFENLFMAETSLMSLSDTDTAFVGLEDSLNRLNIQDSPILNGLEWHQLRNLAALREIRTVKIGLQAIDDEIKGIAHLNLTNLIITQDKVSYISENAFSTFDYLHTLSLKYNLIETLSRSMLPNPANSLSNLILSHNKISSLPEDFFTNMPRLVFVVLAENEFLTMDEMLFNPVWSQLSKIDITGNALRCDCRLKWLLKNSFPKNTWGVCDQPTSIHGKELVNLKEPDLWC